MLYFSCKKNEYEAFREIIIDKLNEQKKNNKATLYEINLVIRYLIEKFEYKKSLHIIDELIKKSPNNFRLYDTKIQILNKLGRTKEQYKLTKKLVSLLKTEAYYFNNYNNNLDLIDYYIELNDFKAAEELTKKLIETNPKDEYLYQSLGDIYWFSKGDEIKWRNLYKKALEIINQKLKNTNKNDESNSYLHYKKSSIYYSLGKDRKA